jgi:hypothetical protein
MLHYDVGKELAGFDSLQREYNSIGKNKLVDEIVEVLELLTDKVDFKRI